MGRLYDLIQAHIDAQPYGVSERQVALKIGVTQTTLSNWREPKKLIGKEHLKAISRVTGVPYARVLDALLEDIGYLHEREDVMGNAKHPAPIGEPKSDPQDNPDPTVTELSDRRSRVKRSEASELDERVAKKSSRKRRGDDDNWE